MLLAIREQVLDKRLGGQSTSRISSAVRCCKAGKEGCIERGFVSLVKFVTALVAVLATGGCAMPARVAGG